MPQLFRTTEGQSGYLTGRPMTRHDVYRMIRRRAGDAGIKTEIGCHTFRATGLYDRRNDQVSLDEVERILI